MNIFAVVYFKIEFSRCPKKTNKTKQQNQTDLVANTQLVLVDERTVFLASIKEQWFQQWSQQQQQWSQQQWWAQRAAQRRHSDESRRVQKSIDASAQCHGPSGSSRGLAHSRQMLRGFCLASVRLVRER